jgi:hypothetical protein
MRSIVSRLWSDSWLLLLRHDGATLRRRRPGFGDPVFDEHQVVLAEGSHHFDEVCEGVLPGLRQAIPAPAAGTSLRVLVGDMWTRLRVIEGDFHRLSDRQIDLMAEVSLQELLEHSPTKVDYRWQIQRGGKQLFVTCLLPGVAERAARLGAELGLQRTSVSTHFAGAWNDGGNPFGGRESGVFAVVAGPYASVAWVSGGIVAGITQGGLPNVNHALDRRVERDLAAWAVDSDAGLSFVLSGSGARAANRWRRHDLCTKAPK